MSVISYGPGKFEDIYQTIYRREGYGQEKTLFYSGVYLELGNMEEMEEKLKILVQSWCDMNQEAYRVRYVDDKEEICSTLDFTKGKDYCSDIGLFKSLQSIRYNSIEAEDGPRGEEFKPIMGKLDEIIGNLAEQIVSRLPEYEVTKTW